MAKDTTTHKLTAPDGTKVEVTGKARRDVLVARGYTAAGGSKSTSDKTTDK